MDQFITGSIIRQLREKTGLTQAALAETLCVSDKAVSKWETGRSYPDITLIEPLASALHVSVAELMAGECVINKNRSFNMLRSGLYVCPVCGNVIFSSGDALISCCGITLMKLESESADEGHTPSIEKVEDEYFVSLNHEMSKEHYISFFAAIYDDGIELKKLYPEGPAEARFKIRRLKRILFYCNRHGLYCVQPGRLSTSK